MSSASSSFSYHSDIADPAQDTEDYTRAVEDLAKENQEPDRYEVEAILNQRQKADGDQE